MIIVDMVQVNGKTVDSLGNALVPSRVVDCRGKIVHPRRIRLRFGLLAKDRSVEENISDITQNVVLNLHFIRFAEDHNCHGIRFCILRVLIMSMLEILDLPQHYSGCA